MCVDTNHNKQSSKMCYHKLQETFFSIKVERQKWGVPRHKSQVTKMLCVLSQITTNNFFLWKDKDKNLFWAGTNHNKQRKSCVSTNHKKYFFSTKGPGQKIGVGLHRSQWTDYNFFYRNTKTNLSTQIIKNNFFLWKDKDKNVVCAGTNHS